MKHLATIRNWAGSFGLGIAANLSTSEGVKEIDAYQLPETADLLVRGGIMTSPSNSIPNHSLPSEARWDELASHLPQSVAELGIWIEDQLHTLEDRFGGYVTERSLKKDLLGGRPS